MGTKTLSYMSAILLSVDFESYKLAYFISTFYELWYHCKNFFYSLFRLKWKTAYTVNPMTGTITTTRIRVMDRGKTMSVPVEVCNINIKVHVNQEYIFYGSIHSCINTTFSVQIGMQ